MSDLFNFNPKPPAFAVVGNPVNHSKSPEIHAAFGRAVGITLTYERMHVDIGGFEQAIDNFAANGGRGLNITTPFKGDAWRYVDELSPRATSAEAVNTIRFDDTGSFGDNTDGIGFMRDLSVNHGCDVVGRRVLVLGAGGAVQGIVGYFMEKDPASVVVANRTVDRAAALVQRVKGSGNNPLFAMGLDALGAEASFDIIVHATSAGLSGHRPAVPASVIGVDSVAYDIAYGEAARPFLSWCEQNGARRCVDGVGMLVEQAAESFHVWHGVRPPTAEVITELTTPTA